jgi:hypothetical protein
MPTSRLELLLGAAIGLAVGIVIFLVIRVGIGL